MAIVPASIRNNNPGAMYPGPSARKFGGSSYETLKSRDGTHKIATFPSKVQGGAAQFDLLVTKYTGRTVEKAIARWCGEFYLSSYITALEVKGGVKRHDMLTPELLRDSEKAIPLAKAMAWQEAGRDFPMTDEEWAQAHHCAFQQPIAPAFSTGNDVPSPKAETRNAEVVRRATPVATVAAVAAGGATQLIDPTIATTTIAAWQGLGRTVGDASQWAMSSKMTLVVVAAGAVYALIAFVGPKIWRRA